MRQERHNQKTQREGKAISRFGLPETNQLQYISLGLASWDSHLRYQVGRRRPLASAAPPPRPLLAKGDGAGDEMWRRRKW